MHAYNDLLWAVFGWTTAGRVIMYGKSECKVNTNVLNVYLFTTIPHSQQQAFIQHKFATV